MTERDLIREVVEKSITLKAEIEPLRAWAKEQYERSLRRYDDCDDPKLSDYYKGKFTAFRKMIQKLDELEART